MSLRGDTIRLRRKFGDELETREKKYARWYGVMGDGEGNIYPDTTDETIVYVRKDGRGRARRVRNTRVVARDGLHVIVGFSPERPDELQVLDVDSTAVSTLGAYGYVRHHHQSHELLNTQGGDDTVWVYPQQFLPFLVQVTDPVSLYLDVQPGRYTFENVQRLFVGGTTPDMSTYAPGVGLAVMVLIYVDASSGALRYLAGAEFSSGLAEDSRDDMIPPTPEDCISLAGVYVPNGITEVDWDYIYDIRPFVNVNTAAGRHNILSSVHMDTSPGSLEYGGVLVVGASALLTQLGPGTGHQLFKMDAAGDEPAWSSFDWDQINQAAGADMVHDHLSDPEGGLLGYALRTGWNADADTEVTMAWNDGTLTLTLTPTGASYSFWVEGTEYTEAVGDSVAINDTEGIWYIYYDNTGTLTASQVAWDIRDNDKAFVAVVYWDATNNLAIGGSARWEMHSWVMDAATHEWAHDTIGTRWGTGLAVSENPADQLEVTAGNIHDEDIEVGVSDGAGAGLWEQDLSPLQSYKAYKLGAGGDWRHGGAFGVVPVILDGGNDVQWNEFVAGAWQLSAAGANEYCAYWVICTSDIHNPVAIVAGQGDPDSNINTARDNNPLDALDLSAVGPEFRVLARVMVRNIGAGVFYEVSAIDDFRQADVVPSSGTFTDHNALPGLQGGAAGEYYHLDAQDYTDISGNTQLADLWPTGSPTFAALTIGSGGDIDPTDASGQDLGDATHRWDLYTQEVIFGGATGSNIIHVPDNLANALNITDGGGAEYLTVISDNTQMVLRVNDRAADIDFEVESIGHTDAFQVQGADGQITLGALGAGFVQSTAGGVLSSAAIAAGDLPAHTHSGVGQGGSLTVGTTDTDATLGSIFFAGVGGVIQEDNTNLFWDNTNKRLGVGTNAPANEFEVEFATSPVDILVKCTAVDSTASIYLENDARQWRMRVVGAAGDRFELRDVTGGTAPIIVTATAPTDSIRVLATGNIAVNSATASGKLHVDNTGATAQPVLYLDQGDVSEEMIQFETTIGVGNAIEAVGGKTLTTTHFIKVTLPGALTRYIPVGTIA